jgi:hypothetical protein
VPAKSLSLNGCSNSFHVKKKKCATETASLKFLVTSTNVIFLINVKF